MNQVSGDYKALHKGARLSLALKLNPVNQAEFCEKSRTSLADLHSIQNGSQDLKIDQAQRITEALREQSIVCTLDWLMQGQGFPPYMAEELHLLNENAVVDVEAQMKDIIEKEFTILNKIYAFKKKHKESKVHFVDSDGMEPLIQYGDYLGGVQIKLDEIEAALNRVCLVMTRQGDSLIRYLTRGSDPEKYTLTCLNPKTTEQNPILSNIEIASVTPIMWIKFPKAHPRYLT